MRLYTIFPSLIVLFAAFTMHAQNCPQQIGNQNANDRLHFKITSGTCNDYPVSINIEEQTYSKSSCNGTNLFYTLDPGKAPVSNPNAFLVDFGFSYCEYTNGDLSRSFLSSDKMDHTALGFHLLHRNREATLIFDQPVTGHFNVINLSGQRLHQIPIENQARALFGTASLKPGIYLLQVVSGTSVEVKKMVVY